MYKLSSQILILILCIMTMVLMLPVSLNMIVCVLLGIILCCSVEVGLSFFGEKTWGFLKPDTCADIFIAAYIVSGCIILPVFYMIPYVGMSLWKKNYRFSRLATGIVVVEMFVEALGKLSIHSQHLSMDSLLFSILEVLTLSATGILLSYGAEMLSLHEKQLHQMRDESAEHDLLMEKVNHQLIETQNEKIYNATLKERNRIAREIHDNVGHMITRSILQVGAIGIINKEETLKTPIAQLKETLDTAMDSMRKSVHDLYDESIDLKQALLHLKPLANDLHFILEYDCESEIPRDVKYAFISIAKEAVTNTVKHSNGDQIKLIVREHPAFYQFQIMDNGTRINRKNLSVESQDGIGIQNMKERVTSLGGTLQIKTDHGFMIFVTVMKRRNYYDNRDRR